MIFGLDIYTLQGIKLETALFTKNEDAYKISQVKILGEKQLRYTEKYLYFRHLQHTQFLFFSPNATQSFFYHVCVMFPS